MRQISGWSVNFLAWILTTSAICALVRAQQDNNITDDVTTLADQQAEPTSIIFTSQNASNTTYETTTDVQNTIVTEDQGDARKADENLRQYAFPLASRCGEDLSCILYRRYYDTECSKDTCVYFAAYQPIQPHSNDIVFHLSARNADYVAIAFTDDKEKRNTDIIACVRNGNEVEAKSYFMSNALHTTIEEIPLNDYYLHLIEGEVSGRGLWCTVKRALQTNERDLKDLQNNHLQAYLWGNNDVHNRPVFVDETTSVKGWEMSSWPVPLSQKRTDRKIVHSAILPAEIKCNSDKLSCIRYETAAIPTGKCTYETCSYLLAFMMGVRESQNWPLFLSASNAEYVGLGRTQDKSQRASTDVIGCKIVNNTVKPFHYWVSNPNQGHIGQSLPNGLKMIDGGRTKSGLWCSLSTLIHSADLSYSNLTNPAYFLYMWGNVDKDGYPTHWADGTIEVSDKEVDLTKIGFIHKYETRSSSGDLRVARCLVWFVVMVTFIAASC